MPQAHPAPGEFKDFEIRQSWKKMFALAQVCALFVVTLSSAVCSLVQVSPSGHDIIPGTAAEADEDKTPSSDLFFEQLQDQQEESWVLIQDHYFLLGCAF